MSRDPGMDGLPEQGVTGAGQAALGAEATVAPAGLSTKQQTSLESTMQRRRRRPDSPNLAFWELDRRRGGDA
jgi:hypothetical protein